MKINPNKKNNLIEKSSDSESCQEQRIHKKNINLLLIMMVMLY